MNSDTRLYTWFLRSEVAGEQNQGSKEQEQEEEETAAAVGFRNREEERRCMVLRHFIFSLRFVISSALLT